MDTVGKPAKGEKAEKPARPGKLTRYKDLAVLFWKFGRSGGVKDRDLEGEPEPSHSPPASVPEAEKRVATLERMGPTFVKLGQLLSTRADLLPPAYLEALARLQDQVTPFSYEEVERIVTEELGVRVSKAFARFDREPLAAASLAQVHRAELRDGRPVAVKVQRPGIRGQVAEDLEMLQKVARTIDRHTKVGERYQFTAMIEEFRRSLIVELDYRKEAASLARLAENLASFELIVVPRPVSDYSTARVLTMDYIAGTKITDVHPLVLQELDGDALTKQLFEAYLKQIFVDGFFHADPHPGNVFLTPDGRIALLDLGMVARLPPRLQEQLLQMVLAISEGRSDETADIALRIAEQREDFEAKEFRRRVADLVGQHQDATLEELQIGRTFVTMARDAGETGVVLPPELTMLGKTLLNLDAIARHLAPEFDPNAAIRRNAAKLMNQRLLKTLSPGNILSTVIETKDLVTRLPARLNRVLDAVAENKLALKVDTGIDAAQLLVGLQKVANRITLGLVLAALIVGAAMLMRIPTSFTILGYPGLAMIFFLAAAGAGAGMLINTLLHDVRSRRAIRRGAAAKKGP